MIHPVDYFNRIADTYSQQVDDEQREARRRGLELLNPGPDDRILELGCGPGDDLCALNESGAKPVGVDGAPNMVNIAKGQLNDRKADVQVTVAQLPEQLQFEADSFDAVWSSFTLEFLSLAGLGDTLRRIHGILKPSGRVAVVSLGLTWPDLGAVDTKAPNWRDCFIDSDNDALHWKLLIEDLGFEIDHAEQMKLWGETVEVVLATPRPQVQTIDIQESIDGLSSSQITERIRCRQRLCTLGHLAVGPLEEQAKSRSELVRAEAAKCLHWIGAPQSAPTLVELLTDAAPKVRWIAAEGLIKIGDSKAIVSRLIRKQGNSHEFYESASRVIRGLKGRGRKDLADLADAFEDDHPEVAVPVVAQRLHDTLEQ